MNTDVNVNVTAKLAPMQRYILYQCAKYDKGLTIEEIYGVSKNEIPFNADKLLEMDILARDRIMVQRGDRNQLCLHSLKRAGDSSGAFVMPPKATWVADIFHRAQENRMYIMFAGMEVWRIYHLRRFKPIQALLTDS